MHKPPLDSDEIRLLMEVGTVLAGSGKTEPACRVFDALSLLRPERAFPYVGHAMALLNGGRAEEACRVLRHAAPLVGEELPTVQAFLGFALHCAGRTAESQRVLTAAAAADPTLDGVGIARSMLGLDEEHAGPVPASFSTTPPEVE